MSVRAIDLIRERLVEVGSIPEIVALRSAPLIEDKLRADATTKRGNVPSYGKMGDVPINVEVSAGNIHVHGPDWVLQKAQERGQVDDWVDIVRDQASTLSRGGIR